MQQKRQEKVNHKCPDAISDHRLCAYKTVPLLFLISSCRCVRGPLHFTPLHFTALRLLRCWFFAHRAQGDQLVHEDHPGKEQRGGGQRGASAEVSRANSRCSSAFLLLCPPCCAMAAGRRRINALTFSSDCDDCEMAVPIEARSQRCRIACPTRCA